MKSLGIPVLPQSWDTALEWGSPFAAVEPVFCPVSPGPLFSNLLSIPSPITQTSKPYYLLSNSLLISCPDSWALPTSRFPVLPFLIGGKSCPDWFPFTHLYWVEPLASMAWRPQLHMHSALAAGGVLGLAPDAGFIIATVHFSSLMPATPCDIFN